MKKPPRDPDVADLAPTDSVLTVYDEEHIITYLRMLDADKEGADWREVAQIVLHINPRARARSRKTRVRQPSDPCKMDDGARISPLAPWRSIKSKSLNHTSWNNFLMDVARRSNASRDARSGTSCNHRFSE